MKNKPNLQGLKNPQGLKDLEGLNDLTKRKITQPFSNLFNSYTKAYNKMYSRMGSLFIPNFKRKPISSEDYLTRIIIYIHLNPIHHGFVKSPEDWSLSSYNTLLSNDKTWLKRDEVIQWFGNKDQFIKLHHQPIDPNAFKKFDQF